MDPLPEEFEAEVGQVHHPHHPFDSSRAVGFFQPPSVGRRYRGITPIKEVAEDGLLDNSSRVSQSMGVRGRHGNRRRVGQNWPLVTFGLEGEEGINQGSGSPVQQSAKVSNFKEQMDDDPKPNDRDQEFPEELEVSRSPTNVKQTDGSNISGRGRGQEDFFARTQGTGGFVNPDSPLGQPMPQPHIRNFSRMESPWRRVTFDLPAKPRARSLYSNIERVDGERAGHLSRSRSGNFIAVVKNSIADVKESLALANFMQTLKGMKRSHGKNGRKDR